MLLFFVVNSITDQTQLPEPELQVLKLGSSKRKNSKMNPVHSFKACLITVLPDPSLRLQTAPVNLTLDLVGPAPASYRKDPNYRKDQRIIGGYLKQSIF